MRWLCADIEDGKAMLALLERLEEESASAAFDPAHGDGCRYLFASRSHGVTVFYTEEARDLLPSLRALEGTHCDLAIGASLVAASRPNGPDDDQSRNR